MSESGPPGALSRAWFHASIADFLRHDDEFIIGSLTRQSRFDVVSEQVDAWLEQISVLRAALRNLDGWVLFEFAIPRMGTRIDVVVLSGPVVFVLEFKQSAAFDASAVEQVWDYALDLKNFHAASHDAAVVPVLIPSEAAASLPADYRVDEDGVYRPLGVIPRELRPTINAVLTRTRGAAIDVNAWLKSPYKPTPTIIEAARALYTNHAVSEIARNDAGAENLRTTSVHLQETIAAAKLAGNKVICFVTGVPGAGKTLVGLNLATQRQSEETGSHAIYLSGNEPLVAVLREALARDEMARQKARGLKPRKGKVRGSVKAFVQNVHHFRDEALRNSAPPSERVAIFDEAQRAWTAAKTADFMKRKKGIPGFEQSEPGFLMGTMSRHHDWAAVICLVGGGQEINQGEAGIEAWLDAARTEFPGWRMHISTRLRDQEYAAGKAIEMVRGRPLTFFDDSLHLSISMRSFRAENVSEFIKALLDRDAKKARDQFELLSDRYPLAFTRHLDTAKAWIRDRARGSERYGLLASSKALRLKPHAIDIRVKTNPVHWFLNGKDDVRSSFYLEDAATEFQVQGLELDWTCVTWDADLRVNRSSWSFHDFRGSRWTNVNREENRRYLLNAYRVLLTRARQGMVIFVPPGDKHDPTRHPSYYQAVASYLRDAGIPELT